MKKCIGGCSVGFSVPGWWRQMGLALMLVCLIGGAVGNLDAGQKTWGITTDGSWDDDSNWNPAGVPGAGDDVFISTSGTYTVTIANGATFKTLTVGSPTGTKTIEWEGGTLAGTWMSISANAVMEIALDVDKTLSCVLTNRGQVNWLNGAIAVLVLNDGRIENMVSGTVEMQVDAYFIQDTGFATFNNAGTLRKVSGGIGGFLQGVTFSNTGAVDVQSGTMEFNGGFSSSSSLNVAANASIELHEGTYNFNSGHLFTGAGFYGVTFGNCIINGPIVNNNFQLTGGNLVFNDQITGTVQWEDGILSGAPTVASTGVLNLTGGTDRSFSGVLTNKGQIVWLDSGPNKLTIGGRIENQAGGVFDLKKTDPITIEDGGNAIFNNAGTVSKSAVGSATFTAGVVITNTGTMDAQFGSLEFAGGLTSSGTFNAGTVGEINLLP